MNSNSSFGLAFVKFTDDLHSSWFSFLSTGKLGLFPGFISLCKWRHQSTAQGGKPSQFSVVFNEYLGIISRFCVLFWSFHYVRGLVFLFIYLLFCGADFSWWFIISCERISQSYCKGIYFTDTYCHVVISFYCELKFKQKLQSQ